MTILAVNGSPRANGATAYLIGNVLDGARESGAETKVFQLGEMDVSPCTACMGCKKTARCVIEDDMQGFYDAVASADEPKGLVVGTPIYFDHVSAQLKAWLDRLYCYTYTERGEKMFPSGFRAVFVTPWGWDKVDAYVAVVDWLEGRLEGYHGIETLGRVCLPGADSRPLSERVDAISRAGELGRLLAEPGA
jgi:multimeric flavodoxin WrbA